MNNLLSIPGILTKEGLNILVQGETKEETEQRLKKEREDLSTERDRSRQQIYDLVDSITDYDGWIAVDAEILARMASPYFRSTTGFTADELNKLMGDKRRELAFKLEFDDLETDDSVVVMDLEKNIQSTFRVADKTANRLSTEKNLRNTDKVRLVEHSRVLANKRILIFEMDPYALSELVS